MSGVDIFQFSGFSPSAWYSVTPPKFAPISSKCYTLMWVGAPQPALKLIWKNFMISLKAFKKSMKAIACIWVVGMWYNIRMLCPFIGYGFGGLFAVALPPPSYPLLERLLLRRIRALLRHRHRWWCSLLYTTLTSYRRHSKNFSMQPCYAFLQEGRKYYFKLLRRLGG